MNTGVLSPFAKQHNDCKLKVFVEPIDPNPFNGLEAEEHELIYIDGHIIVTFYECCYALWSLGTGKVIGGNLWKKGSWKLTEKSRVKIAEFLKEY